jgi:NACHT domain
MLLELATNLFSTALWELGLKPLYRATTGTLSGKRTRTVQQSLRAAAQTLAGAGQDTPPEIWADFLASDELHVLVLDLFLVSLTQGDESTAEIRAAITVAWKGFAVARGISPDSVGIEPLGAEIAQSVDAIVQAAVEGKLFGTRTDAIERRSDVVRERKAVVAQLIASAPATAKAYDAFEVTLRAEVAARYSQIEPPNLLGRERIEIERLFVTPQLRRTPGRSLKFDKFVNTMDRSVVLGNPGAGKSTLVAKTCVDLALNYGRIRTEGRPLTPWCIELRRLAADSRALESSLTDYFTYWAKASYQLAAPDGAFDWLLCRGRLFVVFDGLDELVDPHKRKDVRNAVESFCRRYTTTPVLVTSRFVGYNQAPLDPIIFDAFQLENFDARRVESYSRKWFDIRLREESEPVRETNTSQFLRDSAPTGKLRENPLMLALLASLYKGPGSIPRNLPDVYDSCASLLFSTWDQLRGIEVLLPFAEHVRPALRELAWWLFTNPTLAGGVTRPQAVTKTAEYLEMRRFGNHDKARASAEQFIDFCRGRAWVFTDQGTTAAGEDLFNFTHRTFLEFFAAEHLAFRKQTAEELVTELTPKIVKEQWDVVALIALQIKARNYPDGADDIVGALVQALRPFTGEELASGIAFLLRLLRGIVPSPPMTRGVGQQVMLYAARGLSHHTSAGAFSHSDKRAVFEAIASVGEEVRTEFMAGVITAERKMMRESRPKASQLGAELACFAGEMRELQTKHFWSLVSRKAIRLCSDDLAEAARRHENVALALWPDVITTGRLVGAHGANAAFRHIKRSLVADSPAPARQLLKETLDDEVGKRRQALRKISELGQALGGYEWPWRLGVSPSEVASCTSDLYAVIRSQRASACLAIEDTRTALLALSLCTFEGFWCLQSGGVRELEKFEVFLRNLNLTQHQFFADVSTVLASRRDGRRPDVRVVGKLELSEAWMARVATWSSPAVAFV